HRQPPPRQTATRPHNRPHTQPPPRAHQLRDLPRTPRSRPVRPAAHDNPPTNRTRTAPPPAPDSRLGRDIPNRSPCLLRAERAGVHGGDQQDARRSSIFKASGISISRPPCCTRPWRCSRTPSQREASTSSNRTESVSARF